MKRLHKPFVNLLNPRSRLATMLAGVVVCALPFTAQAELIHYSSGTGFFVSMQGHVITNAHVVEHCKTSAVTVRNASTPEAVGEIVAVDKTIDLALIRTNLAPQQLAPLRDYGGSVQAGEEALVMGFPGENARTGIYKVVETKIIDTQGPQGEPKWLQFTNAAQQGNSGGPLLDKSGNVVGVVTGKMTLTQYNATGARNEVVKESDIAISLPYLKTFLENQRIFFRRMTSAMKLSTAYIEQQAQYYILNIRCESKG